MTTDDSISVIEDEPYRGLFHGTQRPNLSDTNEPDPRALGDILRSTRQAMGYDLERVADITRVRSNYLDAIEQGDYDRLPSRSFAIGYVRAYARALRLDEETLADMFKRQTASAQQTALRAPTGAAIEDLKPRYHLIVATVIVLVGAVVVWNLFQRQPQNSADGRGPAESLSETWAAGVPLIADGMIRVSKPAPAPKDQDVPVPYYTAGLEDGFVAIDAERQAASGEAPVSEPPRRKAFNPRGAVYGAQPGSGSVIIQAQRSVNLVMRSPNGVVYFARQMGVGEAYRIPQISTTPMLIDVSDHRAFDVFFDGEYAGELDGNTTPISKLNARAAATARLIDAQDPDAGSPAPAAASGPPRVSTEGLPSGPIPYQPATPAPAPETSAPEGQE